MNKYFCSIPWVHLRLDSSYEGSTGVSPCCKFYYEEWDTINPDNHVNDGILPALNTAPFQDIRRDMLAGKRVDGCVNCYSDEISGNSSMRLDTNASYPLPVDELNLEYLHTKFIEVSLDNTCNLECKMCSSFNSTKLRRRDELLGDYVHPNSSFDPDLLDELDL